MTDTELKQYYANLLILQYVGKTKAYATVEAVVDLVNANQIYTTVQNSFTIDSAIGVQLDVIGKYVNASRYGYDFSGPITLTDAEFRIVIKTAILQNSSGSSLNDIQTLLHSFFPGTLLVFDYLGMRMSYFFDASIGSRQLAELFVQNKLLPKPMGVQLGALIYSLGILTFFGFRTYSLPVSPTAAAVNVTGVNFYGAYSMASPWLSYANAVV